MRLQSGEGFQTSVLHNKANQKFRKYLILSSLVFII